MSSGGISTRDGEEESVEEETGEEAGESKETVAARPAKRRQQYSSSGWLLGSGTSSSQR
jgi:hypothetical protein